MKPQDLYNAAYEAWLETAYTGAMSKWVEENPYKVYASQGDELSKDQVNLILAGEIDSFWETCWEWEFDWDFDICWNGWESEFAAEFDYDSWDDIPEEIQEIAVSERNIDGSDLWDYAIANTSCHVVAIPKDETGEYFSAPNSNNDRDYNAESIRTLRSVFGIKNPWKIESMYTDEVMKVCGSLDLRDIISNGKKPTHIRIRPCDVDNILFHTSSCGAGCMGPVNVTKDVSLPADFVNDESNRHGVDAVYGFTGAFWREELTVEWKD